MTHGEEGIRTLGVGERPAPLDPELDLFRPPRLQRDALQDVTRLASGRVLVAEREGRTVGYLTFHPPGGVDATDGWLGIIELGAVEVAPSERGRRVGERLLHAGFADGAYDDAVVFATLFSWHYDLARSGLGPVAYRRMLLRFYARVGLEPVATRDPEVLEDRANALLVRIGPRAPASAIEVFERMRTEGRVTVGAPS